MTVADILSKHGIKLENTAPGRRYTTCPKCSSTRSSNEHRGAKVPKEIAAQRRWITELLSTQANDRKPR